LFSRFIRGAASLAIHKWASTRHFPLAICRGGRWLWFAYIDPSDGTDGGEAYRKKATRFISPSRSASIDGEYRLTILTPRDRTIGVRLREDEYSLLERFCIESGAHSIADVARSAIRAYIEGAHRKSAQVWNANRSSVQMKDLETKVAQLTLQIAQLRASTALSSEGAESLPSRKRRNDIVKEPSSAPSMTWEAGRGRALRQKGSRAPEPRVSR
jgi:hypothetical protein